MTRMETLWALLMLALAILATGCTIRCYRDGLYVWRKNMTKAQRDTMECWKGE